MITEQSPGDQNFDKKSLLVLGIALEKLLARCKWELVCLLKSPQRINDVEPWKAKGMSPTYDPGISKIVLAWGQSAHKNCQCGLATVFCCFAFGTNHCQLGKAVEGRLLTSDRGTFGGTQDLNYLGVGQWSLPKKTERLQNNLIAPK